MYRLTIAIIVFIELCNPIYAEQLTINLATAQRDPIVEVVSPPAGSIDRISFSKDGMLIDQQADAPNQPTGVAGFKMLLAASGDFTAKLDFRIDELNAPKSGWGQGLIFTINFNDSTQTQVKLNQVAFQGTDKHLTSVDKFASNGIRTSKTYSDRIQEGSMIIQRIDNQAILSLQDKNGNREIVRLDCPRSNMRGIEVWSTRQATGNTPTKILLKQLTIDAESFTATLDPYAGFWSWRRIFIVANILIVASLAFLTYRSRVKSK